MKPQISSGGGWRGRRKPLQHHKSGNKDFGKVLMELKVSLPVAERLDLMTLRGSFHPKPLCDSTIPKDQPGCSHPAKGFSSHRNSPHSTCRDAPPALGEELTLYLISERMQHIPQPLPGSCHSAASQQEQF